MIVCFYIGCLEDPDFVNTQAVYARALTQILAYPLIQSAISELFEDNHGSNIVINHAGSYIPLNEELLFGVVRQLVLLVKDANCIFLGYIDKTNELILLPHHADRYTFASEDKLVLLVRKKAFRKRK